jgi:glycosyltransferase involved in cell wall biosynthesis
MKPVASVIICAHNPRPHYLQRVLGALRDQTLPLDQWELLLVDNASEKPLAHHSDLSWHPNARDVHEDRLGHSFARAKGINEACGDLIVFVDDDNVLDCDYLATAVSIMQDASIGALGGASSPLFENDAAPPPHFYNVATWLACGAQFGVPQNLSKDLVDLTDLYHFSLFGAGLVVRRRDMLDLLSLPDFPTLIGRTGSKLSSGDDYEICHLIALKGKCLAYSPRLRLGHMMSEFRLDPSYLLKLASERNGRVFDNYSEARRFYAEGLSNGAVIKNIAKVLLLREPYKNAFSLALHFESPRILAAVDKPIFRNVIGAKRFADGRSSSNFG